jgi:GH15 family glucan-1,4-alpha-glucosidase
MNYQPIENYGIIGNMHTVALVGMNGSIDFMCFPEFDSPSVFAALLDDEKGGRFQLHPVLEEARPRQIYLPDTNVLITKFLSPGGFAEVSDYMPVGEKQPSHALVRRAKTVRGDVRFEMVCAPRFDYARASHRVEQRDGEVLFFSEGPDKTVLRLRTPFPVRIENGAAVAEFNLYTDQKAAFVLEQVDGSSNESPSSAPDFISEAFKETVNYWRSWVGRTTYKGRWQETVNRSALTLKLLTSQHYGSIVASPTFGLPEGIGGERNWDYRYTWIRDASFTVYSLMRLGCIEEADAFMHWIEDRVNDLNPDGSLQIMYGIDGRRELTEEILPHLEGYRGSSPVRIGNGAYDQVQLDIYGELMDSIYLYDKYGEPVHYDLWANLVRIVDWVCANWQRPDEGIWEVRGGQQEFTYSRLMAWVAVDRALRLSQKRSYPAPRDRWFRIRDEIYQDILSRHAADAPRALHQPHRPALAVHDEGHRARFSRRFARLPLHHRRRG